MPFLTLKQLSVPVALFLAVGVQAQDLHIKKNVTVGGYTVSTTDTSIKGPRTREVLQTPAGTKVTIRQCDAHRTIHVNEQAQTYFQQDDPLTVAEARAAALASGTPPPSENSGKIDVTITVTDVGERKTLFGYPARHLKSKVVQESSASACTQVHQSLEIDGWYADLGKESAACSAIAPPVPQSQGCNDQIVEHHSGSSKQGYPLSQTITVPGADGNPTTVTIAVAELSKQPVEAELFDVPKEFRRVNSLAELQGGAGVQTAGAAGVAPSGQPVTPGGPSGTQLPSNAQTGELRAAMVAGMLNPAAAPAAQQKANAIFQQYGQMGAAMPPGMQGMMGGAPAHPAANQVAAPQALGPKAAGKIRIGIAPPEAQLGQGSNAGADYSTPIRNAIVALMSGPAVEIAALDAHVPIQLQAEAQQKQCDFILLSSVAVKHGSGGGFGSFMKKAGPLTSMVPMAGMAKGMGGAVAAQAASAAASTAAMSAQQQAVNQLAGFNGQIKSKDDVSIQYQLYPTGQASPQVQNELKGKAKSDGEDVLTPLLTQAATDVLTKVSSQK